MYNNIYLQNYYCWLWLYLYSMIEFRILGTVSLSNFFVYTAVYLILHVAKLIRCVRLIVECFYYYYFKCNDFEEKSVFTASSSQIELSLSFILLVSFLLDSCSISPQIEWCYLVGTVVFTVVILNKFLKIFFDLFTWTMTQSE